MIFFIFWFKRGVRTSTDHVEQHARVDVCEFQTLYNSEEMINEHYVGDNDVTHDELSLLAWILISVKKTSLSEYTELVTIDSASYF